MQVKKAIYEASRAAWSSEERKREILKAFGISFQFCSLTQLCLTQRPHELQHTRLPCTLPTPGASSISCPLSQWCHPTVSSSVIPFSSCLQSFLASGAFPVSQFFASGGEVLTFWSFSFSISPSNEYSGLISFRIDGFISLQPKGLSRVFSNTTVQNYQFFSTQLFLWSNSHIHTWLLEKP